MPESSLVSIKGFPTSLPEAQIKALLETIGAVDFFECEVDGESLICRCRYVKEEDTLKAKKGFHDLEMGDMTLQVEVEEANSQEKERRKSGRRDGPVEGDEEKVDGKQDKEAPKDTTTAGTSAPRRKRSRFAPPPTGAETLGAAGLSTVGAGPSALNPLPGLGVPGMGMVGGVGALGGLGALGQVGGIPGAGAAAASQMANPQLKAQIELFVGNIPVGTTQQGLVDFLNAAMIKVGLNTQPGNPVASCRLNPKFAFCVLRSPEEAAKALNLNGIPYLGNMLKLQRPSSYHGPPDTAVTWQVLTGQAEVPGVAVDTNSVNYVDKLNCEIFVGNIPAETPAPTLQEYLGGAMVQVGLAKPPNPILSIRMNARFAFLEMRTKEDANNALNLDGIPFGGSALSVRRPKKYEGPDTPHKTWFDVLAECSFGLMGSAPTNGAEEEAPTSTVVRLGNVVTAEELSNDEAQKEVVEDMTDECAKYGPVAGIEIPHTGGPDNGVGYVFIKYTNLESAGKAKKGFGSRTFDSKTVEATFFPEERFAAKDFKP